MAGKRSGAGFPQLSSALTEKLVLFILVVYQPLEVVYHMRKENLASGIYGRIKKGILSLEFPPGSFLQERSLADELGVSRTPVREAIHCLSQEGWVVVNSRRNIQVRSVSVADLRDVFLARRLLERDALELLLSMDLCRQAGRRMSELLALMAESRGDLYDFISTDRSFHSVPFQVLANSRLLKFWNSVSEEVAWLGMLAMDGNRFAEVLGEHGRIVEALTAGRRKGARDALLDHLAVTEGVLMGKISALAS